MKLPTTLPSPSADRVSDPLSEAGPPCEAAGRQGVAAAAPRLSDALHGLLERARGSGPGGAGGAVGGGDGKATPSSDTSEAGVTFAELMEALGERSQAVLVLLLGFPFLVPTPPGFSTPAGAAIAFLGVSILLARRPWLPGFVARRRLSLATLEKLVGVTLRLFARIEKLVKPRMGFMLAPGLHWLIGLSLVSAAFVLALPIPIPWNNGPPAIVILLLGLGLLERDGLLVLLGHVGNLALWVVLYFAGSFLLDLAQRVIEKFA